MEDVSPECCRRSFAASIKDTAKRLLENPKLAPRKVTANRMEICRACNHFDQLTTQCSQCLCIMSLKTTFANVKCPLDKWGEHNEN